ncbi:MAG: hypothetical protein K2J33_00485 [Alistipes sp.]|nr:hypothetical protein [Alistipes sp.]
MRLSALFTAAAALLAAAPVLANGDPVAFQSALLRSGNPTPRTVSEIRVVSERLRIVPHGLYTDVEVRYLLHNASAAGCDDIDYGFPVDYIGDGGYRYVHYDEVSEKQQAYGWRDDYIRRVAFALNGRSLPCAASDEVTVKPAEEYILREYLSDEEAALSDSALIARYGDEIVGAIPKESRRWFYTRFSVDGGAYAELEVRYSIANPRMVALGAVNSLFGQWDRGLGSRFVYDFTPAAHWGDGRAGSLTVEIDMSDLCRLDDAVPAVVFSGLPLRRDGCVWRYAAADFDFASAESFDIGWDYGDLRRCGLYELPVAELLRRRIDPAEYSVETSADARYPASNLSDLNPGTACVVERDAEGRAEITVRFAQPVEVAGVLFFNGYMKSTGTYARNSRVDRMRVEVLRENGSVQTVESDWRSGVWRCMGLTPDGFDFERLWAYADKITLTPIVEYGIDWYADKTYGIIGESSGVASITFSIESVAAGTHFDDLCVSEIMLFR